MSDFKDGDVVKLKSGGPNMTIEKISTFSMSSTAPLRAKCVWFDGTTRLDALFSPISLVKVDL